MLHLYVMFLFLVRYCRGNVYSYSFLRFSSIFKEDEVVNSTGFFMCITFTGFTDIGDFFFNADACLMVPFIFARNLMTAFCVIPYNLYLIDCFTDYLSFTTYWFHWNSYFSFVSKHDHLDWKRNLFLMFYFIKHTYIYYYHFFTL